jgi:hypothetical protein
MLPSPAQAYDGFIKMGMHVEDMATVPFMVALDSTGQDANNYEHSTRYLSHQE